MDNGGVTAAALMVNFDYEWPNGIADTRRANDVVAQQRDARFPIALGTVEPFQGNDACLAEIARAMGELHLDGMVWDHHAQGTGVDDQRMVAFVNALAQRHVPAFVHVDPLDMREGPVHVESLARQAPEATIVALGALSALASQQSELRRIAESCPNLLFDTTITLPIGRIETYVEVLGAQRLLFGTDMYANPQWMFDRPPVLDQIVNSTSLSEADKRLILWENAAHLFPSLSRTG